MATQEVKINKVKGVEIDGKNLAFGGYIYNVNYKPSMGEGPSTMTVTLKNQTGDYTISTSDLGKKTKIKIGDAKPLDMINWAYRLENSDSGKILEIDFVDTSKIYLDNKYIGLKDRIEEHPNVIILGRVRKRRVLSMKKNRVFDPDFKEGDPFRFFEAKPENLFNKSGYTSPFKDNEDDNDLDESLGDQEGPTGPPASGEPDPTGPTGPQTEEEDEPVDETKINDLEYTIKDLYEKIHALKEGGLVHEDSIELLTSEDLKYFWRSHTGKLRDVLSAWCNDLGYVYYWHDENLHFLDTKDKANMLLVKSKIENFCKKVDAHSENESYTLEGTFTRAANSFLGRDGSLTSSMEERAQPRFLLKNFRLQNIPWTTEATNGSDAFIKLDNKDFQNVLKTANYGNNYILTHFAINNPNFQWREFKYIDRIAFEYRTMDLRNIADIGLAEYIYFKLRTLFSGSINNYVWTIVKRKDETDLNKLLERYVALSNFYGRFFALRVTANFYQKHFMEDSSSEWYDEHTLLKNTKMGEALSPLSDLINNFDTVRIKKFFGNNIIVDAPSGTGYVVKERETEQEWKPVSGDDVVKIGDIRIIEGSLDSNIPDDVFLVVAPIKAKLDPSSIQFPKLTALEVFGRTSSAYSVNLVEPKLEWVKTKFPSNFGKPNYMSLDVVHTNLSEQQIRDAGFTKDKPDDFLTEENFEKAHELYMESMNFSQVDPYFSKSITTSSLEITTGSGEDETLPNVGDGLLGIDISISSEGVSVDYSFGMDLLKLRPAGTYFEIINNKKRADRLIRSSMMLNGRRGTPGYSL